jgi:hypothetical protein
MTPSDGDHGRSRSLATEAAVVLGFSATAVAVFLPAWTDPSRVVIGGGGDPNQTIWFLTWIPWAIMHGHNPLLTTALNAPTGVNLMWNSSATVLAVLLWPITGALGVVAAYNTLVTGGTIVSAYCAYRVGRRFIGGRFASVCVGLAYGFSPFLIVQSPGHAKVLWAFMPPLLLLILHDLVVLRRRRPWVLGLALGALFGVQLLSFEEGVALAAIAACTGLVVLSVGHRDQIRTAGSRVMRAAPWAAGSFAAIAGGPLAVQFFGPNRVTGTVPGGDAYVVDLMNLLVPTKAMWLAPAVATGISERFTGNDTENGGYLGVVVIAIIAAVVIAGWRRPLVRWCAFTGAVLLLCSFGPHVHVAGSSSGRISELPLPWLVIEHVPLLGSAYPSRLFIYIDLLAAMAIGLFVDGAMFRMRSGLHRRATAAGLGIALIGVGLSFAPLEPVVTAAVTVPDYFTAPTRGAATLRADSVVLIAPFTQDGSNDEPMVWQAAADMRFRMPEGYFLGLRGKVRADGPPPSTTSRVMGKIEHGASVSSVDAAERRSMTAELARWHVETVIVGPTPNRRGLERLFREVLHAPGTATDGVTTWSLKH